MKLTRIKAIQITRELWKWLAETGLDNKEEWPGWEKYGKMISQCPCCEYAINSTRNERDCKKCPLLRLWIQPQNKKVYKSDVICQANPNSPWEKWRRAQTKPSRKKYATIIYKYCDKLLKRGRHDKK